MASMELTGQADLEWATFIISVVSRIKDCSDLSMTWPWNEYVLLEYSNIQEYPSRPIK